MRLPEPEGKREFGHLTAHERGLSVLVIGDSAAAGVGAKTQENALSGLLHSQLTANQNVKLSVNATTGFTSCDIVSVLTQLPPQHYEVVLISMGVNDVTKFTSLTRWKRNINEIVSLLTTKFSSKLIIFTALPPMHLFPALPHPLRALLGLRARLLNKLLKGCVDKLPHTTHLAIPIMENDVSVASMQQSGFMANDGFHPSSKGYALWAQQVAILTEKYLKNTE
ncbi:SGNH/GDSL hydrolase family protein [Alteromonas sp. D210916BOD_24]